LLDQMDYRGSFIDFKFPFKPSDEAVASLVHLQSIENMVSLMGVEKGVLQFAPNLARGLDYYTGVVFETFIPGKEKYGSVSSGGRYDNLVGDFNPKIQLQGIGGSIGLTRLFDVMLAENGVDLSKQTTSQILVGYRTMDEGCFEKALEVATALRNLGVNTELYTSDVKMKKELQLANKKGIPYTVLVMNKDEIEWVIAHEMAHILNWDMVTMTLLQWLINTFVVFISRILANIFDNVTDWKFGSLWYFVVNMVLQICIWILASLITMWFSRFREYKADAGSAWYVGKDKMIAALEALKKLQNITWKDDSKFATMKISTKWRSGIMMLFSTHPDLDDRINALKNLSI